MNPNLLAKSWINRVLKLFPDENVEKQTLDKFLGNISYWYIIFR